MENLVFRGTAPYIQCGSVHWCCARLQLVQHALAWGRLSAVARSLIVALPFPLSRASSHLLAFTFALFALQPGLSSLAGQRSLGRKGNGPHLVILAQVCLQYLGTPVALGRKGRGGLQLTSQIGSFPYLQQWPYRYLQLGRRHLQRVPQILYTLCLQRA